MELRLFMMLSVLVLFIIFMLCAFFDNGYLLISALLVCTFALTVTIISFKTVDPGTLTHTYEIVSTTPNSVTYLDENHNLHEIKLTGDRTKVFQDGRNEIEIYEGSFMGVVAARSEVHMNNNIEETADSD